MPSTVHSARVKHSSAVVGCSELLEAQTTAISSVGLSSQLMYEHVKRSICWILANIGQP